MMDNAHDLKLSILPTIRTNPNSLTRSHLESFVLKNSFDGCIFAIGMKLDLKNDSKRTVAYNLALSIGEIPGFARLSV